MFFNNIRSPTVHASPGQVSAIVPYAVKDRANLRVEVRGRQSNELEVAVATAAPGIFTSTMNGRGPAVAVNEDGSMNSVERSAGRSSIVTLFVTGEGQTRLGWPDGKLPRAGYWPTPLHPVSVTFGGREGRIEFAGLVYAGVLEINVRVPDDAPTGDVALMVRVGDVSTADGVTVALSN